MPKELLATAAGTLEWREYNEPELRPGSVRVRSEYSAAKHGTELSFVKGTAIARGTYNGTLGLFTRDPEGEDGYPFPVGNMVVGSVTEVGPDVDTLRPGDRVYAWGSFRETHTLAVRACTKLTNGTSWQSVVCNDPAHFAMGAVRDGNVRLGDCVAVFGMGAIGLVAVQLARAAGAAMVIAVDPIAARRAAAQRLGADETVDPLAGDTGRTLKELAGPTGPDVMIDFSGTRAALQQALRGVAFGGTVVCGAFPGPHDAGLDLGAEAHVNIPNVVFSRACSEPQRDHPRWSFRRIEETCRRMIERGAIRGEPIVTPIVPFDDLLESYQRIVSDPSAGIKLGVRHASA
jgi:threonine dehydrogenase-like Zn-dependent dehydrogenase